MYSLPKVFGEIEKTDSAVESFYIKTICHIACIKLFEHGNDQINGSFGVQSRIGGTKAADAFKKHDLEVSQAHAKSVWIIKDHIATNSNVF